MNLDEKRPHFQLGRNISIKRKVRGLTQGDVAHKAGVAISRYKDIERGVSEGHIETRLAIAKVLECALSDLYVDPRGPSEPRDRSFQEAAAFLSTFAGLTLPYQKVILAILHRNPLLAKDVSARVGLQLQALLKVL